LANETVNTKVADPKDTVNIHTINAPSDNSESSLRSQVFSELRQNNGLLPKEICSRLGILYAKYGESVRVYKCQWKREYKIGVPQNALNLTFHNWSGWIYLPKGIERSKAVGLGDGKTVWAETKAKNHLIAFDARGRGLGRLEWFAPLKGTTENSGRVNIYVKTPAHEGKLKKLLASAFFASDIMCDAKYFDNWANTARLKGAHLVKDLGVPLPHSVTTFIKEGLGVTIKTGDLSHPNGLEVEFFLPDWAEKSERALILNKIALNLSAETMTQNIQAIKRLFPEQPTATENMKPIPGGMYE
jgi:hypothetical protein